MDYYSAIKKEGSPGGSDSKESDYNTGDLGSVPGSGQSPREGNGNLLQYSCLENGQRSLEGHSPSDHKESDKDWETNTNTYKKE